MAMKILIVSPFENSATGRGDRNMQLEAEMRARGHKVTYLTGNFDHARKSHIDKDRLPPRAGLKVLKLPGYRKNVGLARMWCHFVCALKLWFSAISTRWDVVVISSIPPEALVSARFLRKRALVIDIRDIWPDALLAYGKPSFSTRAFSTYCSMVFGRTLRHADRILIVAPGFRRWVERYSALAHGRVKLVPLGFRREDFRSLSSEGKEYAFCYAGGVTPQFDIREFATRFGDSRGIVLGSGPLLEDWKVAFPNTEFLGTVPRSEAMDLMGRSEHLLFPSNSFAQLPNKAFDYFALGRRVTCGKDCTRAARYLLELRRRRALGDQETWLDYRALEKEAVTKRAADIIEGTVS